MLRRLNGARLRKKGTCLTRQNVDSFVERIKDVIQKNGHCVVAVAGSPGSGKSTCADFIRKNGFFSFSKEDVRVIDDLRGDNHKQYRRKAIKRFSSVQKKNLMFIFDYRSAVYVRKAHIIIILYVEERRRLGYLEKRSWKSYKRYRGFYYKYPPIPLCVDPSRVYIWKDDMIELFKG